MASELFFSKTIFDVEIRFKFLHSLTSIDGTSIIHLNRKCLSFTTRLNQLKHSIHLTPKLCRQSAISQAAQSCRVQTWSWKLTSRSFRLRRRASRRLLPALKHQRRWCNAEWQCYCHKQLRLWNINTTLLRSWWHEFDFLTQHGKQRKLSRSLVGVHERDLKEFQLLVQIVNPNTNRLNR